MAGTQAAPLPPLAPGEFRFITNAITADGGQGNAPRRFRMVASSTITDLAGNTISLKALNQLADDFRSGLPIFMDHDYTNVVDKLFGQTDMAEVVPTTATDKRSGLPIYDLVVGGPVNTPNPRAVQLHDSMVGGFKFGASIGAIVRDHKRDKETGGMLIDGITGKEASVVGIAKNQRSWAYVASLAAEGLDETLSDDPDEEAPEAPAETQVIAANGEALQQWVTTTGTADTITLGNTGPETVAILQTLTTAPDSGASLVRQDLCKCGHGAECEPGCDCNETMHNAVTAEDLTASASTDETTPGGQEADAATPETAPASVEVSDPAIEQKADFEVEDVAALVAHVKRLVGEIGLLREDNARLTEELTTVKASYDRLSTVEQDATEAIRKVMELPLRRKAVGHVQELVASYPGLDPRVTSYIDRATKENE